MNPLRMMVATLMVQLAGTISANAQNPAPAADPPPAPRVNLEDFCVRVKALSDELTAGLAAIRQLVDQEKAAKRISDAAANSLKWSLQISNYGLMLDLHPLLESARVPMDHPALQTAMERMIALNADVQLRRHTLFSTIKEELRNRVAWTLENAQHGEEPRALRAIAGEIRNCAARLNDPQDPARRFWPLAYDVLGALEQILTASARNDLTAMGAGLTVLKSQSEVFGEKPFTSEVDARIARVKAPYREAMVKWQEKLTDALLKHENAATLRPLLTGFSEATGNLTILAGRDFEFTREAPELLRFFRDVVDVVERQESAGGSFVAKLKKAQLTPDLSGRSSEIKRIVMIMEEDAGRQEAEVRKKHLGEIGRKLGEVQTPAELSGLVGLLQDAARAESAMEGGGSNLFSSLLQKTAALSIAWNSGNPGHFQTGIRGDDLEAAGPLAKEFHALQSRLEHEVCSVAWKAPELNAGELARVPLQEAIERLLDDLAKKGEWARIYQILIAQGQSQRDVPADALKRELLAGVRAFLAGQNYELAELWADAARSYKSVLSSPTQSGLVQSAAERLKVLAKDHPETAAKATQPGELPTPEGC